MQIGELCPCARSPLAQLAVTVRHLVIKLAYLVYFRVPVCRHKNDLLRAIGSYGIVIWLESEGSG